MRSLPNLVGKKFGRLTVLMEDLSVPRLRKWTCLCDCGLATSVVTGSLKRGATTSCGCFRREKTATDSKTHGLYGTPTYISWIAMLARCRNPQRDARKFYGGRGITVDPRWASFAEFYADMGDRPPGMSLERKDSNLGYGKNNCCWATAQEQALSRRNTRWVEHAGVSKPMSHWAAELGYSWAGLRDRLLRLPKDQAMQPKVKRR